MTKTYKGRGQVWDPTQSRIIAQFSKPEAEGDFGAFTTADAKTIERLDAMGYRGEVAEGEAVAVTAADLADAGLTGPSGQTTGDAIVETVTHSDAPKQPKAERGPKQPKAEG